MPNDYAAGAERPTTFTLEPDQLRAQCINRLRAGQRFVVEIEPGTLKDVCVLHVGAEMIRREDRRYIEQVATHTDDACQYVWNLIATELPFAMEPEFRGERREWRIVVEVPATWKKS